MPKCVRSSSPNWICWVSAHGQTAISRCWLVVPLHKMYDRLRTQTFQRTMKGKHIKRTIYMDNCRCCCCIFQMRTSFESHFYLSFFYSFASLLLLMMFFAACHIIHLCLYVFHFILLLLLFFLPMSAWLIGFVASTCCFDGSFVLTNAFVFTISPYKRS